MYATNGIGNSAESTLSAPATPTAGGGGAGDPYVTTIRGDRYKLPIMDGPIRFYQGDVEGKTLTVNAQLRTLENAEMYAENLRSFNDLKGKMPAAKLAEISKSVFAVEKLAFFEKFYIHYDDTELVIDVWDQKFKIESYTGNRFPSTVVDGGALTKKYTEIYSDYRCQTIELAIGPSKNAKVCISVYPAKLLRNGIFIEAGDMATGNGALVHTLSQKDMTLPSLTAAAPVSRKDTRPVVKNEWFLDKDGYRTKKIFLAA